MFVAVAAGQAGKAVGAVVSGNLLASLGLCVGGSVVDMYRVYFWVLTIDTQAQLLYFGEAGAMDNRSSCVLLYRGLLSCLHQGNGPSIFRVCLVCYPE